MTTRQTKNDNRVRFVKPCDSALRAHMSEINFEMEKNCEQKKRKNFLQRNEKIDEIYTRLYCFAKQFLNDQETKNIKLLNVWFLNWN